MKNINWTPHAEENLTEREIDPNEVYLTIENPELRQPGHKDRIVLMRIFFDTLLKQKMLLRVVIEETVDEIRVITVYKTSKIEKYFRR